MKVEYRNSSFDVNIGNDKLKTESKYQPKKELVKTKENNDNYK